MATKDKISLEIVQKIKFTDLEPFGKFTIKFRTRQGHKHNIIPVDELEFDSRTGLPLTDVQDNAILKFMLKNKTDILYDGENFYTRTGGGFTKVYHKKLGMYRDDEGFRSLFD